MSAWFRNLNDIKNSFQIEVEQILEFNKQVDFESVIRSLIYLCNSSFRYLFIPNDIYAARKTRIIKTWKTDIFTSEPLEVEEDHSTFVWTTSYVNKTDVIIWFVLLTNYSCKC
jgi:hypothetical protein